MDDIVLKHARVYNPVYAHDYYLRTRHLKGRKVGTSSPTKGGGHPSGSSPSDRHPSGSDHPTTKTAQELKREAENHLAELQNKLDQLRFHLEQMVKQAKQRSGVSTGGSTTSGSKSSTSSSSSSSKSSASTSKSSTSSSSSSSSSSKPKPLTAAQKHKKAVDEHKWYQQHKPNNVHYEIKQVEERIIKVRAELKAAVEHARRQAESKSKAASYGR